MKINDNVQIVRSKLPYAYLLVKWQKEQIEVGLSKKLAVSHVRGPSFTFYFQQGKITGSLWKNHNLEREWEKTKTDEWIKTQTRYFLNSQDLYISINENILRYSKRYALYCVDVEYDLITQKGNGWIYPNPTSITDWFEIVNPTREDLRKRPITIYEKYNFQYKKDL